MRVCVVGLGIQGKKRKAIAGRDVVATVDPVAPDVEYKQIESVPLEDYDAALVCTPDQAKLDILRYLLANNKHVLVEKPLLAEDESELRELLELARRTGTTCYTAYNHRFEPHIAHLKQTLSSGALGQIYLARFFYGNGTALDVKRSVWRDAGIGVASDIGSHLLDMALFLFGDVDPQFTVWSFDCLENRACDHVLFGSRASKPVIEFETTLLSWRNTFTADVYGELGSAHVNCLCKWGPSAYTVRKRIFPSGRPTEEVEVIESADPTWALEYEHFKRLCLTGEGNIENDIWINSVLKDIARQVGEGVL
ncbi:MAG TPA: Gfo/Idh/MocA family oxidoreductase [Pyrinomonadaceae bacterium]|jgi:predicted dehydrogenase